MSRHVAIEWADFGVRIEARLLDEENPRICEDFWQSLPFKTIFAASMSAGEMFKVPLPDLLSDPEKDKLRPFPDEPSGSILYLHTHGSLLVKYGISVEPFRLARLALIAPDNLEVFRKLTGRLRDAYFFTKVVNYAAFQRA